MGNIRTVDAGAGFRWLADAYALGKRDPGAVLGGAAWVMLLMVLAATGLALVQLFVLAGRTDSWIVSFAASLVMMLPVLLVMAMAAVGYLRLLSEVDAGHGARAADVFRGFADFKAAGRVFAIMLTVTIAQQLVMIVVVATAMPDVARWYVEAMRTPGIAQPAPLPSGFWRAYGVMLLVMLATYSVQAIAVTQAILGHRQAPAALRDGVMGVLRNLPALLVCLVGCISIAMLALVAMVLAVFLLTMVSKLGAPWLALLIALPAYLLTMIVMLAFSFAALYVMWRDITDRPAAPSSVEA